MPLQRLLSKPYAESLCAKVDPAKASKTGPVSAADNGVGGVSRKDGRVIFVFVGLTAVLLVGLLSRDRDLTAMCDIFNDAWANNWGFVPFTHDEFLTIGHEMLLVISDDFIQIAEVDGEPSAFIVMLPNINEAIADLNGRLLPFGWAKLLWRLKVRYPHSARVPLMGVRQKFHHTRVGPGLAFAVIHAVRNASVARGIKRIEMSWILENNAGMRNIIETIGGKVSKRYRMYEKDLV